MRCDSPGSCRQDSAISVFTRDSDGAIRHSYTGHPWLATDITERGIDELTSISVLDLRMKQAFSVDCAPVELWSA